MRKYKYSWKADGVEGELEGLISNWKQRLEEDAPDVLEWEEEDYDSDSGLDF